MDALEKFSKRAMECDWCGVCFLKYPSQIREHNFCGNDCRLLSWRKYVITKINVPGHGKGSKRPHLSALNKIRNKIDNPAWRPEIRKKIGDTLRDRGEGKTYRKLNKRHEHRTVAEEKLGRPLKDGEIVHHIDGNKRNNAPENLMVCSREEHARIHFSKKVVVRNENIQQ